MEAISENELVAKDLSKALTFFKEVTATSDNVTASVKSLINRVKSGEFETSKGISFLELKSHMLLDYMLNTSYIVLQKTHGKKIEGDPAIMRLAEGRTVLERMRPIEQKLKYQIDKLVKSIAGNRNERDPLRFTANPDNLMSKLQEEDSSNDGDSDAKEKETKAYVPPKLTTMHYEGDIPVDERKQKAIEQARKKALSSSIMRELKAEYYDGPEEIWEESSSQKKIRDTKVKQRTEYEEDYFVRLTQSKKEKHRLKNTMSMSNINNVTDFRDISILTGEHGDDIHPKRKRQSTDKKGKKRFKKTFKKKRH